VHETMKRCCNAALDAQPMPSSEGRDVWCGTSLRADRSITAQECKTWRSKACVTTQRDGRRRSISQVSWQVSLFRVERQSTALADMSMIFPTRVASTCLYVQCSIATISNVPCRVCRRNLVVHPSCHTVAAKACSKPQACGAHWEIRDDVP
jgi:hypothetical protein